MASGKGCFTRILTVFLVLLIALIVLVVTLFFLATGASTTYPAPKFDGSDTGVVANVITRLARSLVDKEGRVVQTAVLHLSQNEVQTLLNAEIAKSVRPGTQSLPYAVVWDAGRLHLHYSMPVFSGRAANISVDVSPVIEEGELTLIPGSGAVGQLSMPHAALNYAGSARREHRDPHSAFRRRTAAARRTGP